MRRPTETRAERRFRTRQLRQEQSRKSDKERIQRVVEKYMKVRP